MRLRFFLALAAATSVAFAGLSAQDRALADFPEKSVTINVGFGAGGGVDTITRAIAPVLSEALGETVIVVNQPGAGGAVATTRLKATPADGYTLVATTSTTLTFDPHTGAVAFDVGEFDYIAAFGTFPEALIALPSRGWADVNAMLEEAKANGSALTYASNTAIDKMVTAALSKASGVTINPVPVESGAESVSQTLGGHVDFAYSSGTYYPQAVSGDVMILAGLGDDPVPGFESRPTLRGLGYDISSVNMILYLAPKGLPDDAKAKLAEAFEAAAKSEALLSVLDKRNMGSFTVTGDALTALVEKQYKQFGTLAKGPN
ncbi:Bug family tripartite tricarboxylate transporter substrate binding protein [Acuticoccus kandeliae]|uniref:Bug family tripartite tricarboxylate transporter substrate binding protein n=1 Tax=Acuticoccus kandeliae TaxID=2073160 RepID=UPI00130026B0|nr:tripartite tricarboxylate transporter substrate binding protein [Acuticoccus kandeliae]